ncbi:MAG: hypothetical protein JO353_11940, partial [Phycisphaerae bacterium]|nr:hypothetical protein [Phycisphaerae bacterium]
MAEEVHSIRSIHWREVFPFTVIFRSFRVAIHPSKLILALLALIIVYLGGTFMDTLVPTDQQAVWDEMPLYELTAHAADHDAQFTRLRQQEIDEQNQATHDALVAIGKPNG